MGHSEPFERAAVSWLDTGTSTGEDPKPGE
jgi:CPA2 family monovalent cation:H+ antiporter-2